MLSVVNTLKHFHKLVLEYLRSDCLKPYSRAGPGTGPGPDYICCPAEGVPDYAAPAERADGAPAAWGRDPPPHR